MIGTKAAQDWSGSAGPKAPPPRCVKGPFHSARLPWTIFVSHL